MSLLDITVEKESDNEGKSELDRVMAAFKVPIEAGELKVVLAKSYQKYLSLGSGKVMAGSVTVLAKEGDGTDTDPVANATKSLTEAEASLDWMQNDDSQLLAHFLTEGSDGEVPMLKHAANNAAFAQKMSSGGGWLNYEPDLPFVMVKQEIPQLPCRKRASNLDENAGFEMTMGTLINHCGADYKDSFAFLGTSYLTGVPVENGEACRITLGQDTEAEVVEKLWSIGHVAAKTKDGSEIGPKAIATAAAKVADSACKEVSDKAKLSAWAEKAIGIAKRNGVDVKALEADWAKYRQQLENPENPIDGVKSPEEMRTALKQALEASHGRSKNKLGDQLEITSSAFPMRVPEKTRKGDDVGAMVASVAPTRQGQGKAQPSDETRFAPNIVASCLNLMAAAYGPEDADAGDLATIEQLYEAAIGAGLQGVSASAQTKIIAGWTRLQKDKLLNPATRKETLGKVAETAKTLPHPEDRARVLSDSISDEAFESAEPDDRDQIAQDLTGGLDFDLRMIFVSKLATMKQFAKARACIAAFRKQLKEGEAVRPDRVSGSPDNASGAPVALGAEEVEKRLRQLQNLETVMLLNQIDALKSAVPNVTLQTQKDFSLRVMELGRGISEQTAKAKEVIAPAMEELVKMLQQHSQSLVGRDVDDTFR